MTKGSKEGGSSSFSASKKSALEKRPERRRRAKRGHEAAFGTVESDWSTSPRCSGLDADLTSEERVEGSSECDIQNGASVLETYSSQNAPTA